MISYKELFDFDGLDQAFKDLEQSEKKFASTVGEDIKRIAKSSSTLKTNLVGVQDALKGLNITSEQGRSKLKNLVSDSEAAAKAFVAQQTAINNNKAALQANREEIADLRKEQQALKNETEQAKAKAAEYKAEVERLKIAHQALKNELQQGKVSQQQYNTETAKAKVNQAALNAEILKGRLADQALNEQIKQLTLKLKELALANKLAKDSIKVAAGSYREAEMRLKALGISIKNAEGGFKSTSPLIKAQIKEYNQLNNELKKFDEQLGIHTRKVGDYKGALGGAIGQLTALAASYLSASAILTYAFDSALKMDAIKTSLEFIFGSTQVANDKIAMLQRTAERLGLEFSSLAEIYKSFSGAAKASNFPMQEADRLFNAVANAGAKLKLSTEQVGGSLLALQQMISKGNVQAEELRGQLGERLPGAFAIAARAMGVTEQELGKLLQNGQVLASDLLPKLATELDKTFKNDTAETVNSLQGSVNRLKNEFFDMFTKTGNVASFFQAVSDGARLLLHSINNVINSRSWKEFTSNISDFLRPDLQDINKNFSYVQGRNKSNNKYISGGENKSYDPTTIGWGNEVELKKLQNLGKAGFNEYLERVKFTYETAKKTSLDFQVLFNLGKATGDKKAFQEEEKLAQKHYTALLEMQKAFGYNKADIDKDAKKDAKALSDAELTSIEQITKRIAELKKLDGSAIVGSAIHNRIMALKQRIKELNGTSQEAKDGIEQLEQQVQKMQRAIQLQALAARNKGMDFAPSKEALKALDDLTEKLQYARDIIESSGLNRNTLAPSVGKNVKLGPVSTPSSQANFSSYDPKIAALSDAELLQASVTAQIEGNKALTRSYQEELERRARANEKHQQEIIDSQTITLGILANGFRTVSSIIGDEWNDLFGSLMDSMQKLVEGGKLSLQDFASISNGIISGVSGTMQQASNVRIENLEKEKDREVAAVGDNTAAKAAIEDRYNRKITAEKRKQAKADKDMALLSIAINTAAAVASVLSTGGGTRYADFGISAGILTGFVIAMGAAQAALVATKPLPQFWKGTDNSPEGYAEIAERGPEALLYPNGKAEIAEKRQVKWLPKGTKVKTAEETRLLRASSLMKMYENNRSSTGSAFELDGNLSKMHAYNIINAGSSAEKIDYDKLASAFGKAVKDIPVTEDHYNEEGYSKYIRERNSRVKDLNARNSRRGEG